VPLAAVLTGLRLLIDFDRLLWLMVFFMIVGGAYALFVFFVVLTPEEKRLLPGMPRWAMAVDKEPER
jgi:protein-S-isoprenylcysteine O-methyltransferase Ste14